MTDTEDQYVATTTKSRPKSRSTRGGKGSLFARIGGTGPWWSKTLRWILALAALGTVGGALVFFLLYQLISIPDANADFQTQTTKVYYADGKSVLGEYAMQDRENLPLEDIPTQMQAAVIAAEDRTFYENRGIDLKGIIRAARDNATSGEINSGGSTITQQYVKVLYLTQERSWKRKIQEAVLSVKIHNQLSKKEILEGYLNTIYFGNGAYGVEVASQTYFGAPAAELDHRQAALLATVINNPSYYDPYAEGAAERILPRYRYVLDGMVKTDAISQEEADAAAEALPEVVEKQDSDRFRGVKGHVLALVQKQLQGLEFTDSQILGGGLRVVTTIDKGMQEDAVAAVDAVRPAGLDELNIGLASVEPGTGRVRALYGGQDYLESQLNWATLPVQPGSTFKVFAVVAALQDGYSLKTMLNGNSPMQVGGGTVANQGDSGGRSFGRIPLDYATQESVNTAFVDITQQMAGGDDVDIAQGAEKVLEAANQAGIPTSVTDEIEPVAVTPLGYAGVPAIDMANAYATIAASGEKAEWFVVEKVSDSRGNELELPSRGTEQSIPEDVAADTLAALQRVTQSGTGTNGQTICPTAGKTGTATAGEDDDQYVSSSWFVGATPKLATAVTFSRGRGNEELEGYLVPFFGGTYPAQTFRTYMNGALEGTECGTFPPPANIKASKGAVYTPPPPPPSPEPEPTQTEEPEPTPTPSPTQTQPQQQCPQGTEGTFPDCTPVEPEPDNTSDPPNSNRNNNAGFFSDGWMNRD